MEKRATRLIIYLLLAAIVLSTHKDFATPGFFKTHDGEYHIVRLMYFDQELKGGQFPVRFARSMVYGYGSPLFTFFYPQIYYWGSLVYSFIPTYSESLKLVAVVASILSIIFMFEWLSRHYSKFASVIGTLLFLLVPYRFVITYVTGAHQMLLSLMWLPLLLLSIFEVRKKKIWLILEAVAMAGLITAHNVSALIFFPLVLIYIFVLDYDRRQGESWIRPTFGVVWGILLSASFLLPALLESSYVYLGKNVSVNYQEHWPTLSQLIYSKWGYGFSDSGGKAGLSFQLGLAQWIVVGLAAITAPISLFKRKKGKTENLLWLCWLIFVASFFMMLPISDFVWRAIPLVQQIQFPWRILILVMVATSVMGAFLSGKLPRVLMILIVLLAIYANRNHLRSWERIRYSDADYVNNSELYNGTTDIAHESLPKWVTILPFSAPTFLISDIPGILRHDGEKITLAKDAIVPINKFYYPSQKVVVDGILTPSKPTAKGLIEVSMSKGTHTVSVELVKTDIEKAADLISVVSLVSLVIYGLKRK